MNSTGGQLLTLLFLLIVSGLLFANDEIITVDPGDGRLMNAMVLGEWNTADDYENWTLSSVSNPAVTDGYLTGTGSSASPGMTLNISSGPDLDFAFYDYLQFRIKVPAGFSGNIIVYYGTTTHALNGSQQLIIPSNEVIADDQWHIYRMYLGLEVLWRDTLNKIQFQPFGTNGNGLTFSIDYFEVGDLPGDVYTVNTNLNLLDGEEPVGSIESKHAAFWWSQTSTEKSGWTNAATLARRALRMIEECYPVYCIKLGYHDPWKDGYKLNFITWYDGYWQGDWYGYPHLNVDASGLQDEGWGNPVPHEFGHCIQSQQPGFLIGGHWESHANYLRDSRTAHYAEFFTNHPSEIEVKPFELSNLRQDHGKLIYSDFRIHAALEAHAAEIGLPSTMVSNFWQATPTDMTVYAKLAQMLPGGYTVQDVVGHCLRYWPLLDMNNPSYNAALWATSNDESYWHYINGAYLIPCADKPGWWRVPLTRAPEKFAYMSHTLTPTDTTVTVEFRGMDVYMTAEDWRWCLAAVDNAGNARYSDVWQPGTHTMSLNTGENKVYLIVVATPENTSLNLSDYDNVAPVDKHADRLRYPYEVRIVGAEPAHNALDWTASGHTHSNGGGWVASTATVASTAYVGPNAKVLGYANVSQYARIEDYAVVAGSAQVRGYAVVSGYALVQGSANISGYARIRDRAIVEGSATVTNFAKIEEFAHLQYDNPAVSGNAIVRGVSKPFGWGSTISGTAIASYDYSMFFSINNGVQFSHVPWGEYYEAYYSDTNVKPRGLVASYRFDNTNTGEICWDEFGDKHAFFRGNVSILDDLVMNGKVLSLNGQNQYVVFDRDLCDSYAGGTYSLWVKPTSLTAGIPLLFMGSTADKMIKLSIADGVGHVKLSLNDGAGTSLEIVSADVLSPKRWTNITAVLNGSTASLYLDGTVSAQAASPLRPEDVLAANEYSNPEAMYIGRDWQGNLYNGLIDDVRFYNLALTPAEIANEIERKGDCIGVFFMDTETEFDGTSTTYQSGVHNGLQRRFEADIYPHTSDDVSYYEGIFDCTDERASGSKGSGIGIDAGYFKVKLDGLSTLWNTGVAVQLNQWQHIILAFNGTTAKFYVDGTLQASHSYSTSSSALAGKNYRIGFAMYTDSTSYYFDGLIKNAKIYDRMEPGTVTQPQVDINDDGIVDLADLLRLLPYWTDTDSSETNNWSNGTDLNMDGTVNLGDVAKLSEKWLLDTTGMIPTVEGNFSQTYDFLINGTEGTGWDGLIGIASATAISSNIDRTEQLFMQSSGAWAEPWDNPGPFLYKTIDGDFIASVKVSDYEGSSEAWVYHNNAGLMARASTSPDQAGTGEDWVSIDYFPIWDCGNMVRTADNDVRTDGVANNGLGFGLYPYLQIERNGNNFYFRVSSDGANWTLLHGPVTRSDFDGLPLQVGLFQTTYSTTSGYAAFDDFVITEN